MHHTEAESAETATLLRLLMVNLIAAANQLIQLAWLQALMAMLEAASLLPDSSCAFSAVVGSCLRRPSSCLMLDCKC